MHSNEQGKVMSALIWIERWLFVNPAKSQVNGIAIKFKGSHHVSIVQILLKFSWQIAEFTQAYNHSGNVGEDYKILFNNHQTTILQNTHYYTHVTYIKLTFINVKSMKRDLFVIKTWNVQVVRMACLWFLLQHWTYLSKSALCQTHVYVQRFLLQR